MILLFRRKSRTWNKKVKWAPSRGLEVQEARRIIARVRPISEAAYFRIRAYSPSPSLPFFLLAPSRSSMPARTHIMEALQVAPASSTYTSAESVYSGSWITYEPERKCARSLVCVASAPPPPAGPSARGPSPPRARYEISYTITRHSQLEIS
jgi:hypothetical protein